MKATFTLLLFLLITNFVWAQPPNDDCANATSITLNQPPNCPNTSTANTTVTGTTVNATPVSPYPQFTCGDGSQNSAPAAEVWYTFTAVSSLLSISVNGMTSPNVILFQGDNCAFLGGVDCASGSGGSVFMTANVEAGVTYYVMVSGGSVNDVGSFTMTIGSSNSCDPCLVNSNMTFSPPPVNGTYSSGQAVTFCYTIYQWQVTGTIEWMHSLVVDFGPGWDYNTLVPIPPPSCDGAGQWGWYESWTSTNTGLTFGPGFAYDSNSGGPLDGNPGNNWGDGGNGCSDIGGSAPPVTFCWTINVATCPPNTTGADLGIVATVYTDGDSGSWGNTGCNSGTNFPLLASAICCDDLPIIEIANPTSCPGATDGSLILEGEFGNTYDYTIFDLGGNIIATYPAASGQITIPDLPAGTYTIVAVNVLTNCTASTTPIVVPEGTAPDAFINPVADVCPGQPFPLSGGTTAVGGLITYNWTGPMGFVDFSQNPANATAPGTYTLVVSVDGCDSQPVSITVNNIDLTVSAFADPPSACPGENITLFATSNQPNVSYSWVTVPGGVPVGNGSTVIVPINQSTTYQVTVNAPGGCSNTDQIDVIVNDPPILSADIPNERCANTPFVISLLGADSYFWDDGIQANPRIFELPAGNYTYFVTGIDQSTGCTSVIEVSFNVFPPPNAQIVASPTEICAGDMVTLTASGGISYTWDNGLPNVAQVTVSPTQTTTYTVTVRDFDSCESTTSITITVDDPLEAPTVSCGAITPNSVEFLWDDVPGATGYTITPAPPHTGTQNGNSYTVTGLSPGEDVTITVIANGGGVCGDASTTFTCTSQDCPPGAVVITDIEPLCDGELPPFIDLEAEITGLDPNSELIWFGSCITDSLQGIFEPGMAPMDTNLVTVTLTNGDCVYTDSTYVIINSTPTADFTASTPICETDQSVVTYTGSASTGAIYTWNFDGGTATPGIGAGPHSVSFPAPGSYDITLVVEENGCISEEVTQTVQVDANVPVPTVTCGTATTTSVIFNWTNVPGAAGYDVNVLTGPTGTLNGFSYEVTGLQPGESVTIELVALSGNTCPDATTQMTCEALPCPTFSFNFTPVPDICFTGSNPTEDLEVAITGGDGNGTLVWSGLGVTDGNNGVFDPNVAGVGTHTITATYTEGPCSASETMEITIFDTPSADFTIDPTVVCINDSTTVTYTGGADANDATFAWTFNGGTADPGTGAGPHTVSWATGGTKTITLTVTENGCVSETVSQTVTVETPLPAPVINCNTSISEITFTWEDVPGADSYTVSVIGPQSGTQNGNSFTVTGLTPQESVTIEVVAVSSGPCGNSSAQQTCVAEDCPDVMITLMPVSDICLYDFTEQVDLQATVTGGAGGGTESWSGTGVVDMVGGTFDPQVSGAGTFTINYTYTEGNCTYNSSQMITVFEQPEAGFTATSPVCVEGTSAITFTGNTGGGATYDWNFDGGTIVSGMNQGPYSISWPTAGTKNISLTVTENGCVSEEVTQTVEVFDSLPAPIISCESTNTSVTFTWEDVPGATGYQITGSAGTRTGNTYEIIDLIPGTGVTITVIAETDNPCGNSSATLTCIASDCEPVTLNVAAPIELCADDQVVTLTANPQGGVGGGTLQWLGQGIADPNTGNFDPSTVTPGTITVQLVYTEGVCMYDTSFNIMVNPVPTITFVADSPLCIAEEGTIEVNTTASANATYIWDFDGGIAVPGTGVGPHQITWSTAGTKTISVQVTDNGCTSSEFTQTVEVEAPLAPPIISCVETTSTSVLFGWDAVPGAVDYIVDGPAGTLDGLTYSIIDLTPGEVVEITVTAVGNGPCGNSENTASCIAQDCQPLTVALTGTDAICAGESASVSFDFTGSSTGPFTVSYTLSDGASASIVVVDGESLDLGPLNQSLTITVDSIMDNSLPDCIYPGNASWDITVSQPVDAGQALDPLEFCSDAVEVVTLADLITGADPGGQWVETSSVPSFGGAFNAAAGTFNTTGQAAGVYTFTYRLDADEPCVDDETTVTVELVAVPTADAGDPQVLTCNMGMVTIGGQNSSTGPGITYNWTSNDPEVIISNPNSQFIDVSQGGTYIFTVTNELGCTATDEVVVDVNTEVPSADVSISGISCFQANDGAITIENVNGGVGPYEFSLNGADFSSQTQYAFLPPDTYTLVIRDQNGCFSELSIDLNEPDELVVTLVTNLEAEGSINYGDSLRLEAIFNPGIVLDTIIWEPDSIQVVNSNAVWVAPLATTNYTVTIIDENGCSDSDDLMVFVRKPRPVYIPSGFSPNEDGINDVFYIHGGSQVVEIKSFLVFNRWGESLMELYGFPPNDPTHGWDGTHRGQPMNSGVYVYYAEIEFNDGEVVIFKGDVSLMR